MLGRHGWRGWRGWLEVTEEKKEKEKKLSGGRKIEGSIRNLRGPISKSIYKSWMLKRFLSQSLAAAEGTKVVTNVNDSGSMSVEMGVRVGVGWLRSSSVWHYHADYLLWWVGRAVEEESSPTYECNSNYKNSLKLFFLVPLHHPAAMMRVLSLKRLGSCWDEAEPGGDIRRPQASSNGFATINMPTTLFALD